MIKTSDNILKLKRLLDEFDMGISYNSKAIEKERVEEIINEHTENIFAMDSSEIKIKNYEKLVYQLTKLINT